MLQFPRKEKWKKEKRDGGKGKGKEGKGRRGERIQDRMGLHIGNQEGIV